MPSDPTATAFKRDFIERTRWARVGRGYTQVDMAELLELPQDHYKQYESRSLLPHKLVARFCLVCGIDEKWLFTGKGRAPMAEKPPREQPRRQPDRRTKAA